MNIRCLFGHTWAYNGVLYHGIETETHHYICTRDGCEAFRLEPHRRQMPGFSGRKQSAESEGKGGEG